MSAIQEADKAIDIFLEEYDHCSTCAFWEAELVGGVCNAPELSLGYMEDDTLTCEQHEFADKNLQSEIDKLTDLFYNAWQIVEGFLYDAPSTGDWEGN